MKLTRYMKLFPKYNERKDDKQLLKRWMYKKWKMD